MIAELEGQGARYLNVARPEAQWLQLLVEVSRARAALEVGTSFGYSALWIGQALAETDGKLITLDINPERVELARQHLARAGLNRRVDCREGDGHELVPTLEGPFDFVFLDAHKDGCLDYFQRLYPAKLSPGALLLAHSAILAVIEQIGALQGDVAVRIAPQAQGVERDGAIEQLQVLAVTQFLAE